MKTVKINQKSNLSILLFILIIALLAVGSTAFGQKKKDFKCIAVKTEDGSRVDFQNLESVDSILMFNSVHEVIDTLNVKESYEITVEVGADLTWYFQVFIDKSPQWYKLSNYTLAPVKDPLTL